MDIKLCTSPKAGLIAPNSIIQHNTNAPNITNSPNSTFNFNMEIAAELMPALDYRQYFSSIANYDFFNLFVIKGEDFKKNSFVLRADRVLTEDIDADVAVMFPRLDEQITAKVKTYPSIFMSENHGYKQASIDQVAYYGYVTDINPKSSFAKSTVTVSFQAFVPLPQQRLNILTAQLGLDYKDGNDRLSREHFIIKKINL